MPRAVPVTDAAWKAQGAGRGDAVVWVCATCRPRERGHRGPHGGEEGHEADGGGDPAALTDAIRAATGRAGLRVRVERVECMGACARPVAVGLSAPGLAHYVFEGVSVGDAEDVARSVRAWLAADRGWIGDARLCGRLRHCLRARVPAPPDRS